MTPLFDRSIRRALLHVQVMATVSMPVWWAWTDTPMVWLIMFASATIAWTVADR